VRASVLAFLLSDKVSMYTQVDLLPFVRWGDAPVVTTDPLTGESIPTLASDAVGPPLTAEGGVTSQNVQVTRLWGEVKTRAGVLRFGRIPNHWGTGMVFNAGNRPMDEFGDTVDRVSFTGKAGQVFLMGGLENRTEGLVAEKDDYHAAVASVLFQTEKASLGTFHTYRWRSEDTLKYTLWIGDLYGEADLGIAHIEGEFAAIVGGGDLDEGVNDLRQAAFGGNLGVDFDPGTIRGGLLLGFATGDADTSDNRVKTFSYDPDWNQSLFLFQEPMPTLAAEVVNAENGGRNTAAAITGYSFSNTLFIKPRVGWRVDERFYVDLSYLAATQAKQDIQEATLTRKGYGSEAALNLRYDPFPHFWVDGTAALFLPGGRFVDYVDTEYEGGFNKNAWGLRLISTVEF